MESSENVLNSCQTKTGTSKIYHNNSVQVQYMTCKIHIQKQCQISL